MKAILTVTRSVCTVLRLNISNVMEFQKLNYLNCFLIRAMFEIAQQNRVVGKKKSGWKPLWRWFSRDTMGTQVLWKSMNSLSREDLSYAGLEITVLALICSMHHIFTLNIIAYFVPKRKWSLTYIFCLSVSCYFLIQSYSCFCANTHSYWVQSVLPFSQVNSSFQSRTGVWFNHLLSAWIS